MQINYCILDITDIYFSAIDKNFVAKSCRYCILENTISLLEIGQRIRIKSLACLFLNNVIYLYWFNDHRFPEALYNLYNNFVYGGTFWLIS